MIIKDCIKNVFNNHLQIYPGVSIEKKFLRKAIKNSFNRCVIRNKKNNQIYRALLFQNNNQLFSFVPVRLFHSYKNIMNFNPKINLSGLVPTMNNNMRAYQGIRVLYNNCPPNQIQSVFDNILIQIFNQGYFPAVKFY